MKEDITVPVPGGKSSGRFPLLLSQVGLTGCGLMAAVAAPTQ